MQQMILADNIFGWYFAGALRVNLHLSFYELHSYL